MESSRLLLEGRTLTQLLCLLILGLTFQLAGITPTLIAQEADKPANPRKLVTEVPPEYPPVLKRAAIGGIVRLDIIVNPRGAVDFVQVAGGNPILAEAATRAVKKWKYVPASSTTNIRVNFRFDPSH
jgi:TonB family protein